MKKENIFIIVLIAAILIIAFVWFNYFKGENTPSLTRSGGGSTEKEVIVAGQEFITLLQSLEKVKLDTSFLNDPVYKKLKDLTPEIILPEQTGRDNPFLPIQL